MFGRTGPDGTFTLSRTGQGAPVVDASIDAAIAQRLWSAVASTDFGEMLAAALPARVMPDHLTAMGLLASTGIAVAYMLQAKPGAYCFIGNGSGPRRVSVHSLLRDLSF